MLGKLLQNDDFTVVLGRLNNNKDLYDWIEQ
jgi:hypothetical protein